MAVKGFPRHKIHSMLETVWKLESRQARQVVINEALDRLKEDKVNTESKRAINDDRLDYLYRKSVERKDFKTALRIVDVSNKTNGVYDQTNVDNDVDITIEL